jgi:D-alanyl-D-alanine carboxypeptidase
LENALALTHRRADAAAHRERALSARALGGGGDNRVIGAVGDCPGGAVQQYANGQIPLAALCPLAAAPQHRLRADAAYAFDRLSRAYAARFGAAPCITDSYRGYEQQLLLYAQKPGLAAVPGTSNHGWGTALDLCGGIQAFGAATHEWMLDNAPLFGWFHPAWAQAGGSRPEAWHWEYGGG